MKSKMLKRFNELRQEVQCFMNMKGKSIPLSDDAWLYALSFLVDITSYLNKKNTNKQKPGQLSPELFTHVEYFQSIPTFSYPNSPWKCRQKCPWTGITFIKSRIYIHICWFPITWTSNCKSSWHLFSWTLRYYKCRSKWNYLNSNQMMFWNVSVVRYLWRDFYVKYVSKYKYLNLINFVCTMIAIFVSFFKNEFYKNKNRSSVIDYQLESSLGVATPSLTSSYSLVSVATYRCNYPQMFLFCKQCWWNIKRRNLLRKQKKVLLRMK